MALRLVAKCLLCGVMLFILTISSAQATWQAVSEQERAQHCRPGSPMLNSDVCYGQVYDPRPYQEPNRVTQFYSQQFNPQFYGGMYNPYLTNPFAVDNGCFGGSNQQNSMQYYNNNPNYYSGARAGGGINFGTFQ